MIQNTFLIDIIDEQPLNVIDKIENKYEEYK